jgi:hypothetical protein
MTRAEEFKQLAAQDRPYQILAGMTRYGNRTGTAAVGGHFSLQAVEAALVYLRQHLVPEPIRGGTWFYCARTAEHHRLKDQNRFRTEAAYRRHYRRVHGLAMTGPGGEVVHSAPLQGAAGYEPIYDELSQFVAPEGSTRLAPLTPEEYEAEQLRRKVNEHLKPRWRSV